MSYVRNLVMGFVFAGLIVVGCATGEGDEVECPVCDEATEALVGTQCVALETLEECGPDGHFHGGTCHCYGGQDVTSIDGMDYCLQESCGVISEKTHEGEESAEEGDDPSEEGDEHSEEGDEHSEEGDEHSEEGVQDEG